MKKVLSIAGSDSSGGAGIQADLKTITAHKMYAMTAITAITAQNTVGITDVTDIPDAMVAAQIDRVFEDIRPDAVKTGMLSSGTIIKAVAERLSFWHAENLVVDPVMVSTSGCPLISQDACATLQKLLLPLATVITPNIPETEALTGLKIADKRDMEKAGRLLAGRCGCAVLVKGGHRVEDASDCLVTREDAVWFIGKRIETENTHGTGCTLSSAIACALAEGRSLPEAIRQAKEYLTGALSTTLDLGHGPGPLNHVWAL